MSLLLFPISSFPFHREKSRVSARCVAVSRVLPRIPRLRANVSYARGNLPERDKPSNWESDRWYLGVESAAENSKETPVFAVTRVYCGAAGKYGRIIVALKAGRRLG